MRKKGPTRLHQMGNTPSWSVFLLRIQYFERRNKGRTSTDSGLVLGFERADGRGREAAYGEGGETECDAGDDTLYDEIRASTGIGHEGITDQVRESARISSTCKPGVGFSHQIFQLLCALVLRIRR